MYFLSQFISRVLLAPLLPELEVARFISHGQAGTFFPCISIGYIHALPGSGFISARLGHKGPLLSPCRLSACPRSLFR
jgi:NNP family nitrate/nitrite transporter-like MFS transporter